MNIAPTRTTSAGAGPIGLLQLPDGSYVSDRSVFQGPDKPSLEELTAAIERLDISVEERLALLRSSRPS